jgi:hypothetical protein
MKTETNTRRAKVETLPCCGYEGWNTKQYEKITLNGNGLF